MTYRREDEPLIQWLRRLEGRMDQFDKGAGTKQNNIRLGDMLITTNADTNQVCVENLLTSEITCLGEGGGGAALAGWSFSGNVEFNDDPDLDHSPPYIMPEESSAVRLVMACREGFTGNVTVCVNFANDAVEKQITLSGTTLVTEEINVPLSAYDPITVKLTSAGVNCKNLSVFVWFGEPTVGLTSSDCLIEL